MSTESLEAEQKTETTINAHSPSLVPVLPASGTGWRIGMAAAILVVALAAVFSFGLISRRNAESTLASDAKEASATPPAVEVASATRGAAQVMLSLPGEARPFNETTLYARTNGYIDKWLVDIGDQVKQGQTLAIIDTPELDDQLKAAQAKLAQAKSEARLAESAAAFAKVTYDRWQSAAPEGVVSEQERDEKKAQLDDNLAKVDAAKSEIAVAQAEVNRLETLIKFKQVVAPFDGTITQRQIDIGDLVTAGSTSSTTPLFSIAKFDQMRVFVNLPQGAIPEIHSQMKATVHVQEYPNQKFVGTVDRTSESVDRVARTMRVEVIVPNHDLLLKPGSYVEVSFETDRSNPPVEIPAGALTFRTSGPVVALVGSDNAVTFRPIQIARDDGDHIEVASGLKVGDRVALNIGSDVTDGMVIQPSSDSPPPAIAPAKATAQAKTTDTHS